MCRFSSLLFFFHYWNVISRCNLFSLQLLALFWPPCSLRQETLPPFSCTQFLWSFKFPVNVELFPHSLQEQEWSSLLQAGNSPAISIPSSSSLLTSFITALVSGQAFNEEENLLASLLGICAPPEGHKIVTKTPGSFLGEKSQNVDKVSVVDSKSIRKYQKSRMFMPTDKIVSVQKIWAETPGSFPDEKPKYVPRVNAAVWNQDWANKIARKVCISETSRPGKRAPWRCQGWWWFQIPTEIHTLRCVF